MVKREIYRDKTLSQFLLMMRVKGIVSHSSKSLYEMYSNQDKLSLFRKHRLGYYLFDQISLDCIVLSNNDRLIGHGVLCRISWDESINDLPIGWSDSTYRSSIEKNYKNTYVALFARVQNEFRQQGYAAKLIKFMKEFSIIENKNLIIPLRPPFRYKKEYAQMSFSDFSSLVRDDGMPLDPWIRLHQRIGATRLSTSEFSHQHVMSMQDFCSSFPYVKYDKTGYYMVSINKEIYNSFVDVERGVVTINQGCLWVRHN